MAKKKNFLGLNVWWCLLSITFDTSADGDSTQGRQLLRSQLNSTSSMFYVELPEGAILLHVVDDKEKFPVQFGREVSCTKAYWILDLSLYVFPLIYLYLEFLIFPCSFFPYIYLYTCYSHTYIAHKGVRGFGIKTLTLPMGTGFSSHPCNWIVAALYM